MSARVTTQVGVCCYGEGAHKPDCVVLTVPEHVTPETMRAALVDLAEKFEGAETTASMRAWNRALHFAVECGVRLRAAPTDVAPVLCVAALVTDGEGADARVLLVLSAKRGTWEMPGGKCHVGPLGQVEAPALAVLREGREETGLELRLATGNPTQLDGEPGIVVLVYRARAEGAPRAGSDVVEAKWFARGEIPWDRVSPVVSCDVLRAWSRQGRPDWLRMLPTGEQEEVRQRLSGVRAGCRCGAGRCTFTSDELEAVAQEIARRLIADRDQGEELPLGLDAYVQIVLGGLTYEMLSHRVGS